MASPIENTNDVQAVAPDQAKVSPAEISPESQEAQAQDQEAQVPVQIAPENQLCIKALLLVLWAVVAGATGFAYTKCLLAYPKVLADQFVFQNQTVLKMFIAAVGSSMLVQGVMAFACPGALEQSRTRATKRFGYMRVIIGLSIVGCGMAIAGSGPTMVPAALGARVKSGPWLGLGGLVGALAVGTSNVVIKHFQLQLPALHAQPMRGPQGPNSEPGPLLKPHTLNELASKILGKDVHHGYLTLTLGSFMLLAVIVLEILVNYEDDNAKYGGPFAVKYPESILGYPGWPSTIAGCMAGVSQFPVRVLSHQGLGGSASFFTIVSTVTADKLFPGSSMHTIWQKGFSSWQFVHNFVFVFLGALLASFTDGDLDQTLQPITDGFSPLRSVIGMFLCMIGAGVAGGCTCGHGVTGVSELNLESWIGAGALFGAAIATRCIMVFAFDVEY